MAKHFSNVLASPKDWFFYWRISPTLWEQNLQKYEKQGRVLIPFHWAIHCDKEGNLQFNGPNLDLDRLFRLTSEMMLETYLLFPVTPNPIFPNGGLPSHLVQSPLLDINGIQHVVAEKENLNRLYSFFTPKVFGAYRSLVDQLRNYIMSCKAPPRLLGISCGHIDEGHHSYLKDTSSVFQKSYERYKSQTGKGIETYYKEVAQLYQSYPGNSFAEWWVGVVNYCFLGGSALDILNKELGTQNYLSDIVECEKNGVIPNTLLLEENSLGKSVQEIFECVRDGQFAECPLGIVEEDPYKFRPLVFFEIYNPNENLEEWENRGPLPFLRRDFQHCFRTCSQISKSNEENDNIMMVFGKDLNEEQFKKILLRILNGKQVLLLLDDISPKFNQRIELFLKENEITVEEVHEFVDLRQCQLGEGRLILLNTEELKKTDGIKRELFWRKVVSTFSVFHLRVYREKGAVTFWRRRSAYPSERDYNMIRRLCCFNPTNTKKILRIPKDDYLQCFQWKKKNAVNVSEKLSFIEVELFPEGVVDLDFGESGEL